MASKRCCNNYIIEVYVMPVTYKEVNMGATKNFNSFNNLVVDKRHKE